MTETEKAETEKAETERIQKILSQWGVASRRQAEQMIADGRVRLNGRIAHLGQKANPIHDLIEVDDQAIQSENRPQPLYLLLNKPAGIVSTCDDPQGRSTILDLLPAHLCQKTGIHPVGRLDTDSTGALLLTNDGALTFGLTHPKHAIAKVYLVRVQGKPTTAALTQWREGVMLANKRTQPAEVQVVEYDQQGQSLLKILLREGRNRQIRRVAEQLGYPVLGLHRVAIGAIQLGKLPTGRYRILTQSEIRFLKGQVESIQQTASRPPNFVSE